MFKTKQLIEEVKKEKEGIDQVVEKMRVEIHAEAFEDLPDLERDYMYEQYLTYLQLSTIMLVRIELYEGKVKQMIKKQKIEV